MIAATLAEDDSFHIRYDSEAKVLPEEQYVVFHHTAAKLLFMCMRVSTDIHNDADFLNTRVKNTD